MNFQLSSTRSNRHVPIQVVVVLYLDCIVWTMLCYCCSHQLKYFALDPIGEMRFPEYSKSMYCTNASEVISIGRPANLRIHSNDVTIQFHGKLR